MTILSEFATGLIASIQILADLHPPRLASLPGIRRHPCIAPNFWVITRSKYARMGKTRCLNEAVGGLKDLYPSFGLIQPDLIGRTTGTGQN
jgi:hypothetical protein